MRARDMRAAGGLLICLAAFCVTGCGRHVKALPGQDPERAREVLIVALDAWKAGKAKTLATRTPPIRFQDDDFMAGGQLIGYEMVESKLPILPFKDVEIVLQLRDIRGQISRKTAKYQVGLEPTLTVQRSDN